MPCGGRLASGAKAPSILESSTYGLKPVPFRVNYIPRELRFRTMATVEQVERKTLGKVRPHQTQNEGLVFEKSAPGKKAYKLPPLDVPALDAAAVLGLSLIHISEPTRH